MCALPALRIASAADAAAVSRLHAASWQMAYRGVLRDDYLDHAVFDERAVLWRARLAEGADAPLEVLLLEDAHGLLGFASIRPLADPAWGPLIDNLHVQPALKGAGLGRQLMNALRVHLASNGVLPAHHLWVLEANRPARAFYAKLGGREVSPETHEMPDGGRYPCLRVIWGSSADTGCSDIPHWPHTSLL